MQVTTTYIIELECIQNVLPWGDLCSPKCNLWRFWPCTCAWWNC